MMKRSLLAATTFCGVTFSALAAFAATATGTLSVTASVSATCTVGAASLAFGSYDPSSASPLQISTTIPVTCTDGTSYQVGLSAGAGATTTSRSMTGVTSGNTTPLAYGLYQDAGYTTNWGNTPGTDTPAAAIGTGSTVLIPVYGEIAPGQYVPPDSYSDTVVATVTY